MDAFRFTSALRQKSSYQNTSQHAPSSSISSNGTFNAFESAGGVGAGTLLTGSGEDNSIEGQRNGNNHLSSNLNYSTSSRSGPSSCTSTSPRSLISTTIPRNYLQFASFQNSFNNSNNNNHIISRTNNNNNNQSDKSLASPLSVVTATLVKNSNNHYNGFGTFSFGISPIQLQSIPLTAFNGAGTADADEDWGKSLGHSSWFWNNQNID